jgi:hypothetical protein
LKSPSATNNQRDESSLLEAYTFTKMICNLSSAAIEVTLNYTLTIGDCAINVGEQTSSWTDVYFARLLDPRAYMHAGFRIGDSLGKMANLGNNILSLTPLSLCTLLE